MNRKSENAGGFSLLELLTVLGIAALLAGLSVPAVGKMLRASHLNTGARNLVDQLNMARQAARSRNFPVEIRLYRLPDYGKAPADTMGATEGSYRGFQIFSIGEDGKAAAMAAPVLFRDPVMISSRTEESSLLEDAADSNSPHCEKEPLSEDPKLGIYGRNYRYIPFRFTSGGATNLNLEKNFITLVLKGDKSTSDGGNFFTVQIDPVNGGIRFFRR